MRTFLFLFFFFGVIALFSWITLRHLHQPAQDVLSEKAKLHALERVLGRNPQLIDTSGSAGDHQYTGKYLKFTYPANALIYIPPQQSPIVQEVVTFSIPISHLLVSIQVKDGQQVSSLAATSDVDMRQKSKDYQSIPGLFQALPAFHFMKTLDPVEESIFFLDSKRVYSVVVSGSSQIKVHQLFQQVSQSLTISDHPNAQH